jgi:nitronate monooxygenase
MWSRNSLTERLNLEWPIFQAPMGSMTTPALAAAVSNAGGLGGLGMWGLSAPDAERRIAGFRQQSARAVNANYPLWSDPGDLTGAAPEMRQKLEAMFDEAGLGNMPEPVANGFGIDDAHLEMLRRTKPEVISFHFGAPDAQTLHAIKDIGCFTISSATTVAEARHLEKLGIGAIIAQGAEAGGHRGTFTEIDISMQAGLFALLPQVVDAVDVPVIAAGGIADGRTAAAAFVLGASAVQVGTAFLLTEEANVPAAHRAALNHADDASTVVTLAISGKPARAIRNRLVDELSSLQPIPFPGQQSVTGVLKSTGDPQLGGMYAGQSAALARPMSAEDLIRSLATDTREQLKKFS